MKHYDPYRPMRFLLVLFVFFTSCKEYQTTLPKTSTSGTRKPPAILPVIDIPVDDPYFVETADTVSTHGPRSITRNLLQDRHGHYWLASWQGVMRYDGKQFTNITLKEGLRHFHVFSVLEDKNGHLWFGTIGGGVYRYDGTSFTCFTTTEGLANNWVQCMLDDNAGNIWFGTDNGVSRYDGHTFTNFTTQESLGGNSVNSMVQDKTGKIWFGTRGGDRGDVSYYDGKSFTPFMPREGLRFSNVRSIIEDKSGNIWIGGADGLYEYDGQSLKQVTKIFTGYILEDRTGNIWLCESAGDGMALSRYDGKSFTRIMSVSHGIFGMMEDKAGSIWFGTGQGVNRYDGKSVTGF